MDPEKYEEINEKVQTESGRKLLPMVKQRFNIQVEDAADAAKFVNVTAPLQSGPEWEFEYPEVTRERTAIEQINLMTN